METVIKTDVVIVGAGPTGLSLACQLLRYGVDFVILEQKEGLTPYSKAIGVQARTLEIYEQMGFAQEAVRQGTVAAKARLLIGGQVRGELDFSNIGKDLSPFPFVLMLEQSKNEHLLCEYLQSHQKPVLWKTSLESFSQSTGGISVQAKLADGSSQVIKAQYIVGCDGPRSQVRHTLGLTFEGSTFERIFYVADVQIDWKFGHDALHICFAENSFVVFFPLQGDKRYRIVGIFPEEFNKDESDILYEEIEARIREESQLDLDIHDVEWFSTYKVHTRHVNSFSAGRGFLAGDAAHIHTPAGAQGMNTGIQDAYNLAWKLAFTLRGQADENLLATYNEERLENARHLLQTTDRLFGFAAGTSPLLEFLRLDVLPPVARYIFRLDVVRKFVFPTVSQIGIHYRHSSLSQHDGDERFEVKAGDRMPYFLLEGESIYDKLYQPKFHLLVFSKERRDDQELIVEIGKECKEYAQSLNFHIVPLYPHVEEIFGTITSFSVLLRPDNYIGFITQETSPHDLKVSLNKFVARFAH